MNAAARNDDGNGVRKIGQVISSFWYVILILGAILSAIAWGVNLRLTVEKNHDTVVKQEKDIAALQLQVHGLQAAIGNQPTARELFDAIRTGQERNRVQDEQIADITRRMIPAAELQARLDRLQHDTEVIEKRLNNTIQALDNTYNAINEHLRNHDHGQRNRPLIPQPNINEPHQRQ